MRGDDERGADALDLQRPRQPAARSSSRLRAARSTKNGSDDPSDDRSGDAEAHERLASASSFATRMPPQRQEHTRPELRREADAEQTVAEPQPSREERGDRARDQRRRPQVESRQDDRAEEQRRDGGERERAEVRRLRHAQRGERNGEREHERAAARSHQRLERAAERVRVALVPDRRHERRPAARPAGTRRRSRGTERRRDTIWLP